MLVLRTAFLSVAVNGLLLITSRYDEWVKADRIIWPVDKGGPKRKQKKKTKVMVISMHFS